MLQSFHLHFPSVTYFLCCIQVDDTPPLGSRSGRPIELLPSGPISLIGNNAPTLAAIMHRGVRLKKVTTKRMKTSPSVATTALAQAFKVKFFRVNWIHTTINFMFLIHTITIRQTGLVPLQFRGCLKNAIMYARCCRGSTVRLLYFRIANFALHFVP